MKKGKRKGNQKGRQRGTFLYLADHAYAFSRAKCKQRKSRVNSANQEKTVQTKRKQCQTKANSANQMQTMQIKRKQRKSKTNSANWEMLPALCRNYPAGPDRSLRRWASAATGPRPPRQRAAGLAGPVAPSRRRYPTAAARQRAAGTKRARTIQWPDPAARA